MEGESTSAELSKEVRELVQRVTNELNADERARGKRGRCRREKRVPSEIDWKKSCVSRRSVSKGRGSVGKKMRLKEARSNWMQEGLGMRDERGEGTYED